MLALLYLHVMWMIAGVYNWFVDGPHSLAVQSITKKLQLLGETWHIVEDDLLCDCSKSDSSVKFCCNFNIHSSVSFSAPPSGSCLKISLWSSEGLKDSLLDFQWLFSLVGILVLLSCSISNRFFLIHHHLPEKWQKDWWNIGQILLSVFILWCSMFPFVFWGRRAS